MAALLQKGDTRKDREPTRPGPCKSAGLILCRSRLGRYATNAPRNHPQGKCPSDNALPHMMFDQDDQDAQNVAPKSPVFDLAAHGSRCINPVQGCHSGIRRPQGRNNRDANISPALDSTRERAFRDFAHEPRPMSRVFARARSHQRDTSGPRVC